MAYRHNDALYKHKVRAHRLRKIATVSVALATFFILAISVDWILNQLSNSNTVVSNEYITSVQSVNVSAYRTEYFQFQAPNEWVAVTSESNDKRFVYVKNNGSLITQRLVIYVDRPVQSREADFKVTHVLPVDTSELGNFINIGEVSAHCGDSWETVNKDPARITHANVNFVCNPDSGEYNIIIGKNGQNEEIRFQGENNAMHTFTIVFSDLTAYPGAGDLFNIISSFSAL